LGAASGVTHLVLTGVASGEVPSGTGEASTNVSLFDQGLIQILQASVTGLRPNAPYVLAFANDPKGRGALQPMAAFTTNPAGSAIVDASGPIRQLVQGEDAQRRFLVIAPNVSGHVGDPVQIQRP
jgi:hypothetical protein